jgi:hypothetical protein
LPELKNFYNMSHTTEIKLDLSGAKDAMREAIQEALPSISQAVAAAMEDRMLSVDDARSLFTPPVSRPTFNKWADADLFPEYRVGGRRYFKKSEIIKAMPQVKRYKRY